MIGFNSVQAQNTVGTHIPAPMAGINAFDSLSGMTPADSIFAYNLLPGRYGLKVRKGYREWVTGMTGGAVRTVMPFNDLVETGANDELFAVTPTGIWDVSSSTDTPTQVVTFAVSTGLSGWGSWINFTTAAGQFLCHVDEVNGYRTYNGTAWSLKTTSDVTGVNPDNFVFVTSWKNRLWFVERDSANAWYLPTGSITGAATKFNFGSKFKHGGHLVGLYNWTIDGGEGIDDHLVAISSSGDIVVYKGTDPDYVSTFSIQGQWFMGDVPAGRRIASSFGGDLLLINRNGVLPLSQLMNGQDVANSSIYVTRKISQLVRAEIAQTVNDRGWEITLVPGEDMFFVSAPKRSGYPYIQFAQNLTNQAWGIFRNLPFITGAMSNGILYFGDSSGKLYIYSGYLDGVNLAGAGYSAIEFSLLGSFQHYGLPAKLKRVQFIRPSFLADGSPSYSVKALYDYTISEATTPEGAPSSSSGFDSAVWDTAVWGGDTSPFESIFGGEGMGRQVAIALRGTTNSDCTFIGYDIMIDAGGLM